MRLLRSAAVLALTGTGRSTLHKRIREGLMVPSVRLGANSVAWPETEIAAVNAARVAGKTDAEIRQIVAALVEQRGGNNLTKGKK